LSKDLDNPPTTRSWRDIPQPVKPRAMSRGGRWRWTLALMRGIAVVAIVAALGVGAWIVADAFGSSGSAKPDIARGVPVAKLELQTSRSGVLNEEWLTRTLQLPKGVSLFELDLIKLQERLLADGQVLTANVTRDLPDKLVVQITERTPVARIMMEWRGRQQALLVARDGVAFVGAGFDPAVVETLPWLAGLSLARRGDAFLPLRNVEPVAELLALAQLQAPDLYRTWQVVSVARIETDAEIEVTARNPDATIVFAANGDLFRQIAELSYVWDAIGSRPIAHAQIDLSLGSRVPVTITEPPTNVARRIEAPAQSTSMMNFSNFLTSPQAKSKKREL
jgi:hypothetical protein